MTESMNIDIRDRIRLKSDELGHINDSAKHEYTEGKSMNIQEFEKLIEQNKELQELVSRQSKVIKILEDQLKANGIPLLSSTTAMILNGGATSDVGEHQGVVEDVPKRSTRRNLATAGERHEQLPETVVASPALNVGGTSGSEQQPFDSNRSSVYSEYDQSPANKPDPLYEDNTIIEDATVATVATTEDVKAPESSASTIRVVQKPQNNAVQETQGNEKELVVNRSRNSIPEESSESNDSPSSMSVASFKSRIRLPSSLQQRNITGELSNDSSSSLKSPFFSGNTESKRYGSTDQLSTQSSLINNSKVDSPLTQSTSHFSNSEQLANKRVPSTPEAFLYQRFNNKSADNISRYSNDLLKTPTLTENTTYDSSKYLAQTNNSNSQFQILHNTRPEDDDTTLFVKPEDFHTITLTVVSTIGPNSNVKKEDPVCTIAVKDKASKKEMWRIRKSYTQLVAFDNDIRPIIEYFGLPYIPDKAVFLSTNPTKIESRRVQLQNYFHSIFTMPHIPHMITHRICRYLSLDFVNPLDDYKSGARKEGFLTRRYKGLGTSWKIRWCQVDGPFMEIYDTPGGPCVELIKLKGAQIGKQSDDSIAEEKGYRHAFLIMESQKKLSSGGKHFFCAETDEERDLWVEALVEFSYSDSTAPEIEEPAVPEAASSEYTDVENSGKLAHLGIHGLLSALLISGISNSSNTDLPSGNQYDDSASRELKENKKVKKRSIFPFKSKGYFNAPESNQQEADSNLSREPSNQQESNVQHYLDQMNLEAEPVDVIFGRELEKAFELSHHVFYDRAIPSICYRCIDFLTKSGAVLEEGIFRLSGSASAIRQLKDEFNTHYDIDLFKSPLQPDVHTVAGLFKTYLRELPSPIMGGPQYSELKKIVQSKGDTYPKSSLALIFRDYLNDPSKIDNIHFNTCFVIFKFLREIIKNCNANRMNLRNMCIVFVPTLNISLDVLSVFLVDFDCIFAGEAPVDDSKREVLDLYIPSF